jgi:hypothetical protein
VSRRKEKVWNAECHKKVAEGGAGCGGNPEKGRTAILFSAEGLERGRVAEIGGRKLEAFSGVSERSGRRCGAGGGRGRSWREHGKDFHHHSPERGSEVERKEDGADQVGLALALQTLNL